MTDTAIDPGTDTSTEEHLSDLRSWLAQNWDPEFDTSEGIFTVEVVPHRLVIYGGNFSRVNRRPQPGIAVFLPTAGGEP